MGCGGCGDINFYKFFFKKEVLFLKKDYIYIEPDFTQEELKLIKGCLLTTNSFFELDPFKNTDIKNKMKQIDILLKKFKSGS